MARLHPVLLARVPGAAGRRGTRRARAAGGAALVLLGGLLALAAVAAPRLTTAATVLYPNLKALPATDLHFDTIMAGDGSTHHVLRFSSTVWNNGEGALEVQGGEQGKLFQRLDDSAVNSRLREIPKAAILFHPTHNHYHFNNFARYELWDVDPKRDKLNRVLRRGTKITFCIMDTRPQRSQPWARDPKTAQYDGCGQDVQGISSGWGDTYGYWLPDQWIDLGPGRLRDGKYALRTVADPNNLLDEGIKRNESAKNNSAVKCFAVERGVIRSTRC